MLSALRLLGMQSTRLHPEDVEERCRSVVPLAQRSHKEATDRARAIIQYLDTFSDYEDREQLKSSLPKIPFLSVLHPPSGHPLRWWSAKKGILFVAGCDAWPQAGKNLVCTQAPVVDADSLGVISASRALEMCGVSRAKKLPLRLVLGQLKEVAGIEGSPPMQVNEDSQALITTTVGEIYKYLNDNLELDENDDDQDKFVAMEEVREFLSSEAWLHHNGHFYRSKTFAMQCEGGDFAPDLFQVPDWLSRHKKLLSFAEISERFDTERLLEVMSTMLDRRGRNSASKAEIALLIRLAVQIREDAPVLDRVSLRERVVLPDSHGRLHLAKDLSYDDMPWLAKEKKGKHLFLHKDVPRNLALCLGMPSLREARCGGLSEHRLKGFGQKIYLTDMLEQILRKYPADVSILKELIQNADDAGATEIHFVVDRTKYEKDSLLFDDERWSSLQETPALCVFNNRPFVEKDLEGIRRVGRGGKRDDLSTIGRFGIGFNAVYHLTDCPMFLSRGQHGVPEHFCAFDPRLEYCPLAEESDAGCHLPMKEKQDAEQEFAHQLSPFLAEHLPEVLSAEEGSVVFRFPLRTRPLQSKLYSAKTWTADQVEELLGQLAEDASMFLLFLNNLKVLKASVKDGNSLKSLFEVSVDLDDAAVAARQKLAEAVKEFSVKTPHRYTKVAYEMKIKQRVEIQVETTPINVWKRMDSPGLGHSAVTPWRKTESVRHMPRSEFGRSDGCEKTERWLVHQSLGVHADQWSDALVEVLEAGQEHSLSPRCSVAIPLHDTHVESGRVFTFLPLPKPTGLPVHLNAHFVLDDARKTVSTSTKITDIDNVWNQFILSTILPMQYAEALCTSTPGVHDARCVVNDVLKSKGQASFEEAIRWFYHLFPMSRKCSDPMWKELSGVVYKLLADRQSAILLQQPVAAEGEDDVDREAEVVQEEHSLRSSRTTRYEDVSNLEWFPVTGDRRGLFHSLLLSRTPRRRKDCEYLMNLLLQCNMQLSCAPDAISFELFCHKVKDYGELDPKLVRQFFTDLSLTRWPSQMAFFSFNHTVLAKNVISLLGFCLSDWPPKSRPTYSLGSAISDHLQEESENDHVDKWLEGLPLLLRADGSLTAFSDTDPVFPPEFSDLLPEVSRQFVNGQLWEETSLHNIIYYGASGIITALPVQCFAHNVSFFHLPQNYRNGEPRPWDGSAAPSKEWLQLMWRFLVNCSQEEVFQECDQFSIIPTTNKNLMPLSRVRVIGYPVRPNPRNGHIQSLVETMQRLGCPFLDETVFELPPERLASTRIAGFLTELLADISNHSDAIRCLSGVETLDSDLEEPGRLDTLLQHLLLPELDDADKAALRRLRLFPTMNGERVSLSIAQVAFYPQGMPGYGLTGDAVSDQDGDAIVLLDPSSAVAPLIRTKLGVQEIGVARLYDRHLFTQLRAMEHRHMIHHLDYINQNVSFRPVSDQYAESLRRKMETLPFVTVSRCLTCQRKISSLNDRCSHLHTALDLYDPEHGVYGVRYTEDHFPAQCWLNQPRLGLDQRPWRSLLAVLGLQCELDRDRFLEYAREIEAHTSGRRFEAGGQQAVQLSDTDVDWRNLSTALIENLFGEQVERLRLQTGGGKKWANSYQVRSFVEEVSHIPFVFRQKELKCAEDVHPLFTEIAFLGLTATMRTDLPVTFFGSVQSMHSRLVWSYCPVLPQLPSEDHRGYAIPIAFLQHLGLQSPPKSDSVGQHLRNMCLALGKDSNLSAQTQACKNARKVLFGQLDKIYDFLNEHGLQGDSAGLQNTPCVLVNHDDQPEFVLPRQLCFNILAEIKPSYLLRVPHQYQRFQPFLEALGVTQEPQDRQYATALCLLHENHGNEVISDPNSWKATILSVAGLIRCLRAAEEQASPRRDAGHRAARHLQPLFLPSARRVLCLSHQLVFPDAVHLKKRLEHAKLLEFVYDLKECGDKGDVRGSMLPPTPAGLNLLSHLVVEQLHDDVFLDDNSVEVAQDGRLAKNVSRVYHILTSPEFATAVRRLYFDKAKEQLDDRGENVLDQFRGCELDCKNNVVTVLKEEKTGRTIEKTEKKVPCSIQKEHADRSRGQRMMICLEAKTAETQWEQMLEDLADCLKESLACDIDGLVLLRLLKVERPEEIADMLTSRGISDFHDRKAEKQREELARWTTPGRELTEMETFLLINDPTLPFYKGEFVGYQRGEGSVILAQVIGEIEEEAAEGDVPVARYEIQVGATDADTIVVDQLLLYKFGAEITPHSHLDDLEGRLDGDDTIGPQPLDITDGSLQEQMEEITALVDKAFQLERVKRNIFMYRLCKTYHPKQHCLAEQALFNRLFQHLQKCVGEHPASPDYDFRRQVESVVVEAMREEARRLELLRLTHPQWRDGPPLDNDNAGDIVEEVHIVRRVLGVPIRHPARCIRPNVVPYYELDRRGFIWRDGGQVRWYARGRFRFGFGLFRAGVSEEDRMANEATQHLEDLRRLFGGTPLTVAEESRCSHPAQACYKAHQVIEQLIKVCLLCCGQLGTELRNSHDLSEILQELTTVLPQAVNVVEEVSTLQPRRQQAVAAWRAAESAFQRLVQALGEAGADGGERGRLLQLLVPQVAVQRFHGDEI